MTKNILLVCDHHQIDLPLQRSLGHLDKCCEIRVVHNNYDFFEYLSATAFDLVIIDFEISGFEGLELVESVQYIDPGVPVILMLAQEHKAVWHAARQLKAHPIMRPFKSLKFLRLVDKLLHQHLISLSKIDRNFNDNVRIVTGSSRGFLCVFGGRKRRHPHCQW